MTNRRGVNVLAKVERGEWKAGREFKLKFKSEVEATRRVVHAKFPLTFHFNLNWRGGWFALVLLSAPIFGTAVAQEGGWKEDLKRMGFDEVPIEEMEKGEIVGQKWLAGGARPGFLGAKAFFLAPGEPEKVARAILEFDPTKGKELGWTDEGSVKIYQAFQRPPTAEAWGRFRTALGKPPFDLLLQVEGKKEGKIHLVKEEIAKVADGKADGWVEVLQAKIQTYHRGGWKENPGVPAGPEAMIDFDNELREVLKENGPVRDEFRRVLTALAYGGRDEREPVEVRDYWQLMEVDKSPAVALGCGVMKKGKGDRYEVADIHFFASNGYYGAVSLYGVWPYGQGKSLVCRIDGVETDAQQLSQSTARMIAEGLFMREVKAGCAAILANLKGS